MENKIYQDVQDVMIVLSRVKMEIMVQYGLYVKTKLVHIGEMLIQVKKAQIVMLKQYKKF